MNKRIKRIIAMTLALSAFSAIGSTKDFNLMIKEAYAYSSSDDVAFLDDIDLDHGSISFSKTKTSYTETVSSSVDEIQITADPESSAYNVTIDGETKTGSWTKTVDLSSGRNTIRVRVEDPSGVNDPITYYLYITRKSNSSSSSNSDDDDVYLDNITLSDGSISFSKKTKSYDVSVGANINEIRIKAEPEYSDSTVKIDGTEVDESDKYRKTVSLNQGKNVIKINIEDGDNERTYTLNIYRGTSIPTVSVGQVDDTQDEIYLDDLILDDGDIPVSFRPKVSAYAIDVKDSKDSVIIKAEPEDSDNVVRINGDKADSNYRKRVYLDQGKNVIKIKISNENDYNSDDDDYEKREYTLTIYRGTSQGTATGTTSSSNNSGTNNANVNASIKVNQWVNNNGRWQYYDVLGKPLKNMWFLDRSYGAWYFLDEMGYMKTGWIQDGSGKWYYLYPSGAMAYNTVIDGYKVGSDGAWIK